MHRQDQGLVEQQTCILASETFQFPIWLVQVINMRTTEFMMDLQQ